MLAEGRYREWFWSGFDKSQTAYLKAPVGVPEPPEPEPIYKNKEFAQVKGWREKAACAGADPMLFFVEEGADPRKAYLAPEAGWRKLCPQCPVRELCLELARESESEGIFGGKLFVFFQAWKNGVQESRKTLHEYDESNIPRKGRPKGSKNKPKNFALVAAAKRQQSWEEMQKEINDRISNS